MLPSIQLVPTGFGLAAVLSWGTSDFLGGFASRRANAYFLTAISHAGGLVLALALGCHRALLFRPWRACTGRCWGAPVAGLPWHFSTEPWPGGTWDSRRRSRR